MKKKRPKLPNGGVPVTMVEKFFFRRGESTDPCREDRKRGIRKGNGIQKACQQ